MTSATDNSWKTKTLVLGGGALAASSLKLNGALFSLLKSGWIIKASWTMILSFGVYAVTFGWRWALVIIGLTFLHEMGHYWYMQSKKLAPKAPVFIPFVGAYVAMTNAPTDPIINAWSAFAGPLVGGIAAGVLYWVALQAHSNTLIAAASWGFFINLLQLIPIRPFDGGFIASCISKWLFIPGILLLLTFAIQWQSPLLIAISAASVYMVYKQFRSTDANDVISVPMSERIQLTILYFWLAWALGYCYLDAERHLRHLLP